MGGTTQYGEFYTLGAAIIAMQAAVQTYQKELGLFLRFLSLLYDDDEKKYKLAMRFTK